MGSCCSSPERKDTNTVKTELEKDKGVQEVEHPIYVGKYDYDSRTDDDLGFKKGDLMYIISTEDVDWWFARLKDTRKEGYIPSSYVAEYKSLDAEAWFLGQIKRIEAERLLNQPVNKVESFLIRDSESNPGDFSLSVKDQDRVRHYRVHRLEDGSLFVTNGVMFQSLHDLVEHYKTQKDGLCCNLLCPCLQTEKPQTAGLSRQANKEWEIDKTQIQLKTKLGAGMLGEVWEGVWNGTTSVAVKTIRPGKVSVEVFLQEARIVKKLRHPRLIQLYAVCTKEEPIYMVMELMKYGSLVEYLKGEGRTLKIERLVDIAAQVASGMSYLEQQNYIHCDLAARNILVGEHGMCKVADIGLTKVIDKDNMEAQGAKFPIKWTAPEAAIYNRFSTKSDVWSFGVVLYEIITYGRPVYPGITDHEVLEKIQQGYRMPCPPNCPKEYYDIMLDCWHEDPASRPTFETLQWQLEEFFNSEG
uniref:Tyrosine-protein kinase n=1 Tax=Ephydatia fluviatilis TaxID=31330 RepID=Q8WSU3_9METZ|nr:protein tyrosine kinase [Ephydatia fluviatilis]